MVPSSHWILLTSPSSKTPRTSMCSRWEPPRKPRSAHRLGGAIRAKGTEVRPPPATLPNPNPPVSVSFPAGPALRGHPLNHIATVSSSWDQVVVKKK